PALAAAIERGGPVVPLFVWSPAEEGAWAPGAASRWWLHRSLAALAAAIEARGSRLLLRRGDSLEALRAVARDTGAGAVVWNRRYEPALVARDRHLKEALREGGLEARSFNSALLFEPWENTKEDGSAYRVFTPFWNAMRRRGRVADPVATPAALPAPRKWPAGEKLDSLELLPRNDWASGIDAAWTPGEDGAGAELERFLSDGVAGYPTRHDLPADQGTSRLSPHLHFGEIGPRSVWKAVQDAVGDRADGVFDAAAESWLRQLAWREFGHHLLFHFPHTTDAPLRSEFAGFAWNDDRDLLARWQRGLTGYPIVDAGMRELWTTGWMHNRVRMVAASFLVKDLRIAWQEGARWFWDTLVDADLANNTMGWQWTAGCGADAAPYFRVFNPVLQSRRFDAEGAYLRRWLPELAALDSKWIHEPHAAPPAVLAAAGVRLGDDYPLPIVAHDQAKRLALEAYRAMTKP
ncbi:MAG: deoxyribodipyrimidine photo-lyase, partial [Candidatus Binatia bacterium]